MTLAPAAFKAACNRSHARRRAYERYGLDWTDARIAAIEAAIQAGSPDVIPIRPDRDFRHRQWIAVREGDDWIPVVYDTATGSLVSVLPSHVIDRHRRAIDAMAGRPGGLAGEMVVTGETGETGEAAAPPQPSTPIEAKAAVKATVKAAAVRRVIPAVIGWMPVPAETTRRIEERAARRAAMAIGTTGAVMREVSR